VVRPGPASAFTNCSLDSGTETVTTTGGTLTFRRSGDVIKVNNALDCGTVTTVDTVVLDLSNASGPIVDFNLGGGPFAPGAHAEGDGSSEIEFSVEGLPLGTEVHVEGSEDPDSIAVGDRLPTPSSGRFTEINLNGIADGNVPDADVVMDAIPEGITLFGEGGSDVLSGAGLGFPKSHPTIVFMAFEDGTGADTLTGGDSADLFLLKLLGQFDPGDVISGGAGTDFLEFGTTTGGVSVTGDGRPNDGEQCPGPQCERDNVMPDVESIRATDFDDRLVGGPGPNRFEPGGGTNMVSGGAGDDELIDNGGTDVFVGGAGFDFVSYGIEDDPVTVTLDGLADDGPTGAHDNVHDDVEFVFGGGGNDHLVGNDRANMLSGNRGDDVLDGRGGNDTFSRFEAGSNGSDTFIGGPGFDAVEYSITAGNLALSIDGVANDRVVGDPSQGIDNIHTDVEKVIGGDGNDHITGSARANRLVGGPGDDVLSGLGGGDLLSPGPGVDTINGGPAVDTVTFDGSAASISANLSTGVANGDGKDSLGGIERLVGSRLGDLLVGSGGPNRLTGAGGNDRLKGLAGNDLLVGNDGNDSFDGGLGTDRCIQGSGSGPIVSCEP